MASVITNIALVLQGFRNVVRDNDISVAGQLPCVYDDSLEYEHAVGQFRSRNEIFGSPVAGVPLFIFNRSALRYSDLGRHGVHQSIKLVDQPSAIATLMKAVHGVMDITGIYTSPHMRDIEAFEVSFLAEEGICSVREFSITFPDPTIDDELLTYYIHWDEMEPKEVFVNNTYRKGVTIRARVQGWYHVLLSASEGDTQLIKTVNEQISTFEVDNSNQPTEILSTGSVTNT